jgi:hypothetical protein
MDKILIYSKNSNISGEKGFLSGSILLGLLKYYAFTSLMLHFYSLICVNKPQP